jgi:molybdate transport system substrate-binding protein
MRPIFRVLTVLALALGLTGAAAAGEVKVAVAANFAEPAREIARIFERRTDHQVILSFGSSGQFYAQIANGAPFGVFLSADAARPLEAEAAGLAVRGSRFTDAVGRLVLFSRAPSVVDAEGRVLTTGRFDKLAIADPKTAPYGLAAQQTMQRMGLEAALRPKLVQGASITQTFQFVQSGAAELGFVALSQVADNAGGSRWLVPSRLHAPIVQQAVLLTAAKDNPAARAFLAFLGTPEARAVIRRFGYETP